MLIEKVLCEMHVFYSQNVEFNGPNMARGKTDPSANGAGLQLLYKHDIGLWPSPPINVWGTLKCESPHPSRCELS